MGTSGNTEPLDWRLWLWRGLLALGLAIAVIGNIEFVTAVATETIPTDGIDWGPSTVPEPQWQRISSIDPDGSAARAGLKVGDDIRYDSILARDGVHHPGDLLPVTVLRDGKRFRATLVAEPDTSERSVVLRYANLGGALTGLIALGLSVLLLVRGGRARTPLLLAAIVLAINFQPPTLWIPASLATAIAYAARLLSGAIFSYCLPRFCLAISGGPASKRADRIVRWIALAFAATELYRHASGLITAPLPGVGAPLSMAMTVGTTGVGCWVMILNYRRADAATRNRIWIVALAFVSFGLRNLANIVGGALLGAGELTLQHMWWLGASFVLTSVLAVVLLVYAVLRQRLFDIGFAVNRTLVYGAVSFTLLAAFGLAEWGADRLVPESWHHESALYSAGIALLLFLSFHRVRDWFERHVERLFFSGWQRTEADLKRFVASAGHFRQAPALCREFAAEVERFAQGAPAALYLREDGGGFTREAGSLDAQERYPEEDRAFALLAAERAPVDLAEAHSGLPGAMAFPMFDQLGLAGFMLVGPRPDGAHYRPDEIDNLAWATRQVGLDLQALQARELRAEVAALREELAARPARGRSRPRAVGSEALA